MVTETIQTPMTPDEQPLTGGQDVGFGSWGGRHSFFIPSVRVAETLESNPQLSSSTREVYKGFTSVGADAKLIRYWGRDAQVRYVGAFRYDSNMSLENYSKYANTHDVLVSKRIPFNNWSLVIADEAQYSQGSNFGGAGMEGMGQVVGQLWEWSGLQNIQLASNTLRSDVIPSQDVLTGRIGRVSNSVLVESDFNLSSRNTLTLSGTYSLLHFTSSGLLDSNQASGIVGFNRKLSARDSVALEAMYTRFSFVDASTSVQSGTFALIYGRQLTGRLSIDFGGGPDAVRNNISGAHTTDVTWQGRAHVQYRIRKVMLNVRGERIYTSGAGVLDGGISNDCQGVASIALSRNWMSSYTFGVSHLTQLHNDLNYNTQLAGVVLTRTFSYYADLYASYNLQRQTASSTCIGPACVFAGTRHVFGIGLSLTARPIRLE